MKKIVEWFTFSSRRKEIVLGDSHPILLVNKFELRVEVRVDFMDASV